MPQFQVITQAPLIAFVSIFLMLGGVVLLLFGLGVVQSGTGQDIILKFSAGRKTTLIGLVGIILGGIGIFLSLSTSEPKISEPTDTAELIPDATNTAELIPEPTITAELAPTAVIESDSGMYDDFSDPAFDRGLNTSLWEPSVTSPSYIEQQNGVLVISLEPGDEKDTNLGADLDLVAGQPLFIESKMLLSSEKTGIGGGAGFDVYIGPPDGQPLQTWCAISREDPDTALIACTVYELYGTAGVRTEIDTWHTARMEMDSDVNMTFYVDGELVGFYAPDNTDRLKGRTLALRLAAWNSEQLGGVKVNFDDVRIGQLGE